MLAYLSGGLEVVILTIRFDLVVTSTCEQDVLRDIYTAIRMAADVTQLVGYASLRFASSRHEVGNCGDSA